MIASPWLVALILAQASPAVPAPNPVFDDLRHAGVGLEGVRVRLPDPLLADGADPATSRAVLARIAGGERALTDFVRDSVTAPFILKTSDTKAGTTTIRAGDLYFVVYAELDRLDLQQVLGQQDEATTEAGNMRFTTRTLKNDSLPPIMPDRPTPIPGVGERLGWYTHASGRLLDRIQVESTSRTLAHRTADSWTVATATDPAFNDAPRDPNNWRTITRTGATEATGPAQPYVGGGCYVKVTKLTAVPGALLVEGHFAFVEPTAWFDGNPILRSKFGLICQDQVRHLRREIQKRRAAK